MGAGFAACGNPHPLPVDVLIATFIGWVQGLQPAAANPAPIQNLLRTAGGSEDSTREAPDALVHALFFEDTNRTTKEVAMLVDELLHKIFQKRL